MTQKRQIIRNVFACKAQFVYTGWPIKVSGLLFGPPCRFLGLKTK